MRVQQEGDEATTETADESEEDTEAAELAEAIAENQDSEGEEFEPIPWITEQGFEILCHNQAIWYENRWLWTDEWHGKTWQEETGILAIPYPYLK